MSWGIHETTVGRIVRKVEDLLLKCAKFRLPSQRQLYQPGWERKVMLVDVGEVEIERPKKTETLLQYGICCGNHSSFKDASASRSAIR